MAKSKKIIIAAVTLILAVAVVFFARWLIRYYFYNDYREYLSTYEYEEGTEFQALHDSGGEVAGMELAAENDVLKLYADMETDDDAIASTTNKNYLKSQLILDYFNTSRTEGTFDSFSYCTSRGQLEVESIADGIRFIYTLGDLESATGIVPQYISKATLDRVLAALDEDGHYSVVSF